MRSDPMVAAALSMVALLAACSGERRAGVRLGPPSEVSAATAVGTAPMFAVSPRGAQAVAWVSAPDSGTDGRLYVSVGSAPPHEIRDSLGPIQAHGESPPKLAYAPDGALYAVYTVGKVVPGKRFPLSALRMVRSADGGASWSAPVTVTDGPVFGAHSFHALHLAPDGTIYVAWLGAQEQGSDSAAMQPMLAGHAMAEDAGHAIPDDAGHVMTGASGHAMQHEASAAWITRSDDGGRTWSPRVRVDMGEACPCCRTALASGRDGSLYMAWRHVYPGSVRDIVVARSSDRGASWSAPVRVHADDWHFDACPHAGPAIAVDSAGVLQVAWWTGKEGAAGVFHARSTDGGRTFAPPTALGAAAYSRPAHVQLALGSGGRVIVAWDDGTRQVPQVVIRVSSDGGRTFAPRLPVSVAGRAGTFPVLGVAGDSLAIAWSEESAADAATAASARPDMKKPGASLGLEAVGASQVLVRRGVVE